jgi:hypothetical protein
LYSFGVGILSIRFLYANERTVILEKSASTK